MTTIPSADDFTTIARRRDEIRRERAPATEDPMTLVFAPCAPCRWTSYCYAEHVCWAVAQK